MNELRQVVFVCDFWMRNSQRVSKIAAMLKEQGIDVVLIHQESYGPESPELFREVHTYGSLSEALYLAKVFTGSLFHIFSCWHLYLAYELIRNKPGRIIFDNYDCLNGFITDEFLKQNYPGVQEVEKYCLENADGLCCRNMETQYLKRKFNYSFKFKRLFLPDGCSSRKIKRMDNARNDNNGFVFVGGMLPESMDFFDNWHCQIALHLSKRKLHYHIYPSAAVSDEYRQRLFDFINQYSDAGYFHIHEPLPYSKMLDTISEYKYSLYFVKINKNVEMPARQLFGWGNKLYDYLEAGLKTISDSPEGAFMSWIIKRYQMGEIVNGADSVCTEAANQSICEIPRIFTPEFNGPRLLEYYREVMEHDYELDEIFAAILQCDKRFMRAISIAKNILKFDRNNPEAINILTQVLQAIKRPDLVEQLKLSRG